MIPRSITLKGFLCYKDEQVIELDGCDLWVLAGRNGSGKSAVFDAMTYALFKAHRGGRQDAMSLIHSQADELSVRFEFDLGAERYRIKRTTTRGGAADRGVYRYVQEPNGSERWPAVPETQSDTGLKRWVQDNIGLTYETFTASVLLLQGRSENLLGARPAARFEIIAGIVDLESYRRLHKRADEKRSAQKFRVESARNRLQATQAVDVEEIEQAEDRLAEAEAARVAAEAEWKRLLGLGVQAEKWFDLIDRRRKECERREHFWRLLADSEAIARDWARLQELDDVLPAVRGAIARRGAMEQLETQARAGEDERRALSRRLERIASLTEDNRGHLEAIIAEIDRDQGRERAIVERQAALQIPMHRARQARLHGEAVHRLEDALASYPEDLSVRVSALEEEHRRRAGWESALPSLSTLARERGQLAETRARMLAAERAIETATAGARRAEAALAERRAEETATRRVESEARDRATEAATILRGAETRLADLEQLDGRATCDRCGQDLTPEHCASEAARRRDERDRADRNAQAADRLHHEETSRLATAEASRAEAERSFRDAEKANTAARNERARAASDADHHAVACRDAYDHMDAPFRIRVAAEPPEDWVATTVPNRATSMRAGCSRAGSKTSIRG
jgi:DNA repair exonuclease SbcCD ATPase subunit